MKTPTTELLAYMHVSERSIKTVCKRLNGEEESRTEALAAVQEMGEEKKLEPEQIEKGRAWLVDQWKTPRGVERKNNPYGYREEGVLDSFETIRLSGFVDAGNINHHWYVPTYRVYGTEGSFEYYIAGGKPVIIG